MKVDYRIAQWLALLALAILNPLLTTVFAQGTAFNYQGRLMDGANPANGIYDLRFTVYDSTNTPGNLIAGPITHAATGVSNGLFSATLDFGAGVFGGPGLWLEVDVRTNGAGSFTALLPRQPMLPVPYAIMANTASNLLGTLPAGQLSGTVPLAQLPGAVVTNGAIGLTLMGNFGGTFSGYGAGLAGINGNSIQDGTVGSAQLAAGAVTATNLAPGIGVVPSGTIVLSPTPTNVALTGAGFSAVPAAIVSAAWSCATNPVPWSSRRFFGAVVFNEQMWVLGGTASTYGGSNDVWASRDGANWTCVTNAAPWGPRDRFGAVVFNGQMWVLGGKSVSSPYPSDVWSSSDGVTWTCITSSALYAPREWFSAVDFIGQIWVLGGATQLGAGTPPGCNDVWTSSDGAVWSQITSAAGWVARWGHSAVVLNGKMWVLGGGTGSATFTDVWYSSGCFYLFQKQ
ncbi:MAG: hypothetical protein NT154_39410 [Verrucomicrobia bacterium]|nr:hypothetical protein [Verrucomicrobiota bacterium]